MATYFASQAADMRLEPPSLEVHPEDPLGSATNPLGLAFDAPGDRYLMGLHCACGRTSLVAANYVESEEPLGCPGCAQSLR